MDQQSFLSDLSLDVTRKHWATLQKKQMKVVSIVALVLIVVISGGWLLFDKNQYLGYSLCFVFVFYFILKMKIEGFRPFGKIPEPTGEEMEKLAKDLLDKIPGELSYLNKEKILLEEKQLNLKLFLKIDV